MSTFWNKETVMHDVHTECDGPIDEKFTIDTNQANLPKNYTWSSYDITNKTHLSKITRFLKRNYVADDKFSLYYSEDFLLWALTPPNYIADLFIGVETDKGIPVGFIAGIPTKNRINYNVIDCIEVNFLCVHKKLRNKKLTVRLIQEMMRVSNMHGYKHSFYTTSKHIHHPICTAQYYHRILNAKKLVDVGYINKDTVDQHDINMELLNDNMIKMEEKHVEMTYHHFNQFIMHHYDFHPVYTLEEFKHIFYNNQFVKSYVLVENEKVVDFISYYVLPSLIKNNNKQINTAYLYYYTTTNTSLLLLMSDLLVVAKADRMDMLNMLNIMDNSSMIEPLKFKEGTGILNYNVYNWQTSDIPSTRIGKMIV